MENFILPSFITIACRITNFLCLIPKPYRFSQYVLWNFFKKWGLFVIGCTLHECQTWNSNLEWTSVHPSTTILEMSISGFSRFSYKASEAKDLLLLAKRPKWPTPTTTNWSQNIFRVKLKKGIIFSKNELSLRWRNQLFEEISSQEILSKEISFARNLFARYLF